MTKDIYIIKNSVNDKVYVGQSVNVYHRWQQHISDAKDRASGGNSNTNPLYDDMAKFGCDKFYYEILESGVDNYDEREIYWIDKCNARVPNGYNVSIGGPSVGAGIASTKATFKTNEQLMKCIEEISSSKKSFENIAKKYGCGLEVISAINLGKRYQIDGMIYPLRRKTYTDELVKQVRYSIKYEDDLSLVDIANKYGIDSSQVSLINQGKLYYVNSENYPLRKKRKRDLDAEFVKEIVDDIENSDLCMADLAKKHNISRNIIARINNGLAYRDSQRQYPIRPENDNRNQCTKKFFDRDDIRMIMELLRTGVSIKEIAQMFHTTNNTIQNINNGSVKKYRIDGIEYPIRKLR